MKEGLTKGENERLNALKEAMIEQVKGERDKIILEKEDCKVLLIPLLIWCEGYEGLKKLAEGVEE